MTVRINNAFVRKVANEKPVKVREFRDASLRGFVLRQQPTGYLTYYALVIKGSARRGNRRVKKQRIGEHPAISPSEARKAAEELIAKCRLDGLPLEREVEKWTLKQFLEVHYLPWIEQHLKDPAGQKGQLQRFTQFNTYYLDEIDKLSIENWRNKRLAAGVMPSTINRNVVVIRAVLSKAVEWGFLKYHPLEGLKRLKIDRGNRPRTISEADRDKLFDALSARDRDLARDRQSANIWRRERGYPLMPELTYFGDRLTPIVKVAFYTGMRRGEIFTLDWSDIDFDEEMITVRAESAKTSQTRMVPMHSELKSVLLKWKEQSRSNTGLVFPGRYGERLDNFSSSFDALRKKNDLRHIRFKDFRSDFGSRLANNGVDLAVTQRLLGHSSPVVTMRYYVTIQDQTMREAIASMMPTL